MKLSKRAAVTIAFAGILEAGPGMTWAAGAASTLTIKPLQGASFDIGSKRAVSYFLSDEDACKFTLTLAEIVRDDEVNGLTATRMTVAIESGKAAHFDTAEGKSLEFRCQSGARAMSIEALTKDSYHPE
jgi:hypothetical protein